MSRIEARRDLYQLRHILVWNTGERAASVTVIHFIYPYRDRISAPHAIGRKITQGLVNQGYEVINYDFDETRAIQPSLGDVLLGHPHAAPWTIFRRSLRSHGWRRRLAMFPYNHGDLWQVAWADRIIPRCDLLLAVTGNSWFDSVGESPFAHWLPKMMHIDLAVDRGDFPRVKMSFNPPGQRRFLYIGHTLWFKNTPYLTEIADLMPEVEIGWLGSGGSVPGLRSLGYVDFSTAAALRLVQCYDFLLMVGTSDSNPMTILEAAAWGLIPICTREAGYYGYPGIPNVPLGDANEAVHILRELQNAPTERLETLRAANDALLDSHFTWNRVTAQVVEAIESGASPKVTPAQFARRLAIRKAEIFSPYSMFKKPNLRWGVRTLLESTAAGRALLAKRRAYIREIN